MSDKSKRIDTLEAEANAAGITLTELFREANVPHATIQNWRNKEPNAFETLDKLIETLERLKKKQPEAAE